MVSDVAELKFGQVTKVLPGESQRFKVGFGQHGFVNFGDGGVIVIALLLQKFAGVAARGRGQQSHHLPRRFGFGGHRAVGHGEIGAFADGAAIFAQMVAVGKKQELEGFELVDAPAGDCRAKKFKACVALR